MRRSIDFTACPGYYVLFKTERDATMGERRSSAVPARDDDTWHKLFWKCFRRRSLLFTATINNYALPSRSWRSSYNTTARHNAFGKALAALPADHPVFGIAEAQKKTPEVDEFAEWPQVLRPSKRNEPSQPLPPFEEAGPSALDVQQAEATAVDDAPVQPRLNSVNPDQSAMRRDLAFNLYQLYRDCAFFKSLGYYPRRKLKPISEGSQVSYGYVIRSCDAWKETAQLCQNRRGPNDTYNYIEAAENCIRNFLQKTDRMYNAKRRFGANLYDLWMNKSAPK